MPTPTPRRSASGPCSRTGATCRSPSSGPSIIESALAEPVPGWIRGFRMAEPGHHQLRPGPAEGVPGHPRRRRRRHPRRPGRGRPPGRAARGPTDGPADVFHVASGARNPLRYRQLVDLVRDWFLEHPLADSQRPADRRAGVVVPRPGPGAAPAAPGDAGPCRAAEKVLQALPLRGSQAELSARLEERRERGRAGPRLRRAVRGLHRDRGHVRRRPPARAVGQAARRDQRDFCFDPAVIDWPHLRATTSTCPRWSLTPGSARFHAGGRRRPGGSTGLTRERAGPARRARPRAPAGGVRPGEHADRVQRGRLLRLAGHPPSRRRRPGPASRSGRCARRPACWPSTAQDRGDFLRYFYRRYEGAPVDRLRGDAWELFSDLLLTKSFPAGHPPGARAPAPGSPHPAHHRCPRRRHRAAAAALRRRGLRPLGERDGRFTGELLEAPPTGEARALIMADYADANGLDLDRVRRLRRLGQRPADARSRRPSRGRQPRDQAGRHRPQAGLARGALAEGARRAPAAAAHRAEAGA